MDRKVSLGRGFQLGPAGGERHRLREARRRWQRGRSGPRLGSLPEVRVIDADILLVGDHDERRQHDRQNDLSIQRAGSSYRARGSTDGIVTPRPSPRVTSQQAPGPHPEPFTAPMPLDRLFGIPRTRRHEPAATSQYRREEVTIRSNRQARCLPRCTQGEGDEARALLGCRGEVTHGAVHAVPGRARHTTGGLPPAWRSRRSLSPSRIRAHEAGTFRAGGVSVGSARRRCRRAGSRRSRSGRRPVPPAARTGPRSSGFVAFGRTFGSSGTPAGSECACPSRSRNPAWRSSSNQLAPENRLPPDRLVAASDAVAVRGEGCVRRC
jgi:hypothetical protein